MCFAGDGPISGAGTKPPSSGDNCVFVANGSPMPGPRLSVLSAGTALVPLTSADLTDGPWCPDASDVNRYDADLLRVRSVAINLTTEAAISALRGPAGPLFSRAGTARGTRMVPDRHLRMVVTPRALNANR